MSIIPPRFIRQRDAPAYLGMDRNRFDAEVRPELTEIPLGDRSIAYDRLDLDAWADEYKEARGRPGRTRKGAKTCEPGPKASILPSTASGLPTSSTEGSEFSSGSARSPKRKPKPGCESGKSRSTPTGQTNFERAMNSCSA